VVILSPIFLVIWTTNIDKQGSTPDFFVGVEYAIANHSVEDAKALVDRVKNFTNLFVVDSLGITLNKNNLDEVCDYVYASGLYFVVFFITPVEIENFLTLEGEKTSEQVFRYNYHPHLWIADAKEKYGNKFLGAYTQDEPGGNQIDSATFQLVEAAKNQTEAAEMFIDLLHGHIEYYLATEKNNDITVLTSDYGLYWYDYKAGYDAVLVEFAWNHSRPLNVALCRGAANVQNRDWGIMVTWTYFQPPYIVSGPELYEDLTTAYHNGAKYAVIFDHPNTDYSDYGILTEEHFDALEQFWNYMNDNPKKHGTIKGDVVYVLPENFGFGLRWAEDNIWGVWSSDTDGRVEKIWSDVNQLVDEYGFNLDIAYSDPEFNADIQRRYDRVIFWNETGG
jgi:hypothetical protein